MAFSYLELKVDGAVAEVTLNRPEVRNAFDEKLVGELTACYKDLTDDPAVRAIILCGAGETFCAGADLGWMERMAGYSRDENIADARRMQHMFATIAECPKVTIACVQGAAIGGGLGLVTVCDIAVAAEDTRFAFSEVRLGLAPAVIAPYVLRKIGPGAARALFVTGERFKAADALRMGLIAEMAYLGDLHARVTRIVAAAVQAGPNAVAAVKNLLRDIEGGIPSECAETTAACIASLRASDEGQEGIRAFLEKRKPSFSV